MLASFVSKENCKLCCPLSRDFQLRQRAISVAPDITHLMAHTDTPGEHSVLSATKGFANPDDPPVHAKLNATKETEYELPGASVVVICGWISAHSAISSGVAAVAVCSPSTAESVIGENESEGASIVGIGSSLRSDGNLP